MSDALVDELLDQPETPGAADPLVESLLAGSSRIPSPKKTREQSIAEQVGQADLPAGGMRNVPARALIEAADTKLEKLGAFQKFFPDGELAFIPLPSVEGRAGDPVLVFRENPSKPFQEVDAPFLEDLSGGEVVADLVEFFAKDFGTILGESLTAAGGKPLPQGKLAFKAIQLVPQLVKLMSGAFGGELAQEAAERAIIGESDEPIEQVFRRAQGQAVIGAAGGVALDKLGRPIINLAKGAGIVGLRTGAQRAMQAAERLGLKELPATMVSDSPILQRMGRQAASLTTTLNRYVEQLENSAFRAAQKLRRTAKGGKVSVQAVIDAEAAERADIMRILSITKGSIRDAGEAVQQAVADYEISSQGRVTTLYNTAKAIEQPSFEMTSAMDEARRILLIGENLGPEGEPLRKLANDIIGLVDEAGKIPERSIQMSDGKIFSLDATDQIRFLRTRAFDNKQAPIGDIARAPQKLSGRLFAALSETLDNPVGGSPEFKRLYAKANTAARERFNTLDNGIVLEALKTDTPSALAARLIEFGSAANIDNIRAVRQVLPVEKFAVLQKAAVGELLREPFNLSTKLKGARTEALEAMFSPKEMADLRLAGQRFDALAQTGLPQALANQTRMGSLVADLTRNKNSAGMNTLNRIMQQQGGRDSPFGRTLRAGVIDEIVRRSGVFERGIDRIDFNRLRAGIDEFAATGAFRLLKSDDIQGLSSLLRVQDLLRLTPDAGTSLQAASAVAGLRTLEVSALSTIFENFSVGRLVTSPGGIAFLVGKPGKHKVTSSRTIQFVGAVAAQLLSDAEAVGQATEDAVSAVVGAAKGRLPGGDTTGGAGPE